MNLFDILKHINIDKKMNNDIPKSKEYSRYMINRYLFMNDDTIFYASEMNQRNLNQEMHYDFLFNSISKKYRRYNYVKKNKNDKIIEISKFFNNIAINKAKDYLKIIIKHKLKI